MRATIPANYGTVYRMLFTNGDIQPGDLVLVLGASGGVGTAGVQVVKAYGGRVIACAGTDEKCEKLKALGADHAVNYSTHDFSREAWRISGKKGVDVCVNFTGGDTWNPSIRALKLHGKLLTCGATAGFDAQTDIRYIWQRELKILRLERLHQGRRSPRHDRHGGWQDPAAGGSHIPSGQARRSRSIDGIARLLRQDRYDPLRVAARSRGA